MLSSKLDFLFQDWKLSLFFTFLFGGTGFVNYLRRKRFSITHLFADVFTSLVSGFLTFFVATGQGYQEEICLGLAFLVAHNATRLLFVVDKYLESKVEDVIDKIEKK